MHQPVLLGESLEALAVRPDGIYVDGTFGRGGHSRAILARLGPSGRLVALDRDPEAEATARTLDDPRFRFVRARFGALASALEAAGIQAADGMLFDLGVSSPQLDETDRGFAYSHDAPLDMRMDPTQRLTAAEVVNGYPPAELARILREYGEERFAQRIASAIVRERERAPFESTRRLAELVRTSIPAATRRTGGNPAKRTFQALRIEVNGELDVLRRALPAALAALPVGGRIAVLSYHSLEDRITKQVLAAEAADTTPPDLPVPLPGHEPRFRLLTRGAELPSDEETTTNPRAGSVRLRAAERVREAT